MILGIGTDIIELERVKNAVSKKELVERVYTAKEVEYCHKDLSGARFAGRFAAKEAFFKALGTGVIQTMQFNEVEVVTDALGKPSIVLKGKTLEVFNQKHGGKIHVSLSHGRETAIAYVIIEGL